jgi:hypothetical protein
MMRNSNCMTSRHAVDTNQPCTFDSRISHGRNLLKELNKKSNPSKGFHSEFHATDFQPIIYIT